MNIQDLNVDVLYHLSKHFLNEKDILALALSGGNESFTELYLKRRRLVISQCYFIRPGHWYSIFGHINPSMITVFDCSSCYWIPAAALSHSIVQLINLQELSVQDTQIRLENLPQVFEACKKIVKLSFSLAEKNLDQYQEDVINMDRKQLGWMKVGFARVTHLKIFPFMNLEAGNCFEPWLVTLEVLSWCQDCVDLLINAALKPAPITNSETDDDDVQEEDDFVDGDDFDDDDGDDFEDEDEEDLDVEDFNDDDGRDDHKERTFQIYVDLLSRLNWTNKLKSLVILSNGFDDRSQGQENWIGEFVVRLMQQGVVSLDIQNTGLISLKRLWANDIQMLDIMFNMLGMDLLHSPTVKSIILPRETDPENPEWLNLTQALLSNERYLHLEHLAEIIFARFEHLADLTYIRGDVNDVVGLDEFCQSHPKLQQLHFETAPGTEDVQVFGLDDWKLPLLKILVYKSNKPSQRIMDHLIKACPNIDHLHIGYTEPLGKVETADFFNSIRFKNLTHLNIFGKLFDGSYLPLMIRQCPNLERLYLEGAIECEYFFLQLALCLPEAKNLRDLRIQWDLQHGDLSRPLFFLDALLKCCPRLERLALIVDLEENLQDLNDYDGFEDLLIRFVEKKTKLVALCLVGFQINPAMAERVRQRLVKEILPLRRPFWFHLGPELPEVNDTTVPRIHYDGIVNPTDEYFAPPQF